MIESKVGAPVYQFEDHDELYAQFHIDVNTDESSGQTVAVIEAGGKRFEARHSSRTQAISDVEAAVTEARKTGKIIPGIF